MSLFDSGCDDGAGAPPEPGDMLPARIAGVDRYMRDLDRALAHAPATRPRRRAWGELYGKWRQSADGGALTVPTADRFVAVAGAFAAAADLGAKAPLPPPPVAVVVAPAKESHWLRWTLIAGGLAGAGYFGWRWYNGRRRGNAGPVLEAPATPGIAGPGPVLPELYEGPAVGGSFRDRIRVLSGHPAHYAPPWVRDEVIWARANAAVRPYSERYQDPDAVVTEVYRRMGGRIAQVAA
jgi:hypothetical protein